MLHRAHAMDVVGSLVTSKLTHKLRRCEVPRSINCFVYDAAEAGANLFLLDLGCIMFFPLPGLYASC